MFKQAKMTDFQKVNKEIEFLECFDSLLSLRN